MINRLLGFISRYALPALAAIVVLLVCSLAFAVSRWQTAAANAATWRHASQQLSQTVADSEAENAKLRDRMRATEKLLAKHAKQQRALSRRADALQGQLAAAQDAAGEAYQHCRALDLPADVARILHNGPDRPDKK